MLKACIGLNCARQIDFVDRRHCSLPGIPDDIYRHERTLEELLLDFNNIQELPPKFFRLTALRKLTVSENDLNRVPPGIANLTRLVELDISKNAIEDVPQNMQFCRSLHFLDMSSNPLLRTPEAISSITSLTHLSINDTGIPRLPKDIGNLQHLIILEARENALKTLPPSIAKLKRLQRLDVGNNEIEVLPVEIGELVELTELWLDTNLISELPESITKLRNLMVLDITKNRLECLPPDFVLLSQLSDLHLSENCVESLPDNLGDMQALCLIKLDMNHLCSLPESIGKLHRVTELLVYDNMLDAIPSTLFQMQSLEMLNLDRNHLFEIPSTVGQCKNLHVLSLRENEIGDLPEELGNLSKLKVLDIVGNRIKCLPLSLGNIELDALWIDGSQTQPLVALEAGPDPENAEASKLHCSLLPQQGPYNSSMENFLEDSSVSSDLPPSSLSRTGSFGKGARLGVAFDPSLGPAPEDPSSKLVRFPTPFRKDMKALKAKRKKGKYKPEATPSTTIFRKGSSSKDDLLHLSMNSAEQGESPRGTQQGDTTLSTSKLQGGFNGITEYDKEPTSGLTKMASMDNLSQENLDQRTSSPMENGAVTVKTPDLLEGTVYAEDTAEFPKGSVVRTIEVAIDLEKPVGRTLGFSIAGGRGSTPAYEDVDDSIYVTKIAPGGIAEQNGQLRLGDKLLMVNDISMMNLTHAEAVAGLKSVTSTCHLVVSREVLVVLPNEITEEEEEEEENEEERAESPSALPEPEPAKLSLSEGEVTGDENVAKKIVSDVIDKSVQRVELEEEEEESPVKQQHDNYINFDIAQIVVKESRKDELDIKSPVDDSPLHSMRKPEEVEYRDRQSRPSVSMSMDDEDDDYPEERVILDRSIGKLGLSIVGGADHISRVFGQGRPGLYISKISKGGAAEATGKLRLGDRILEVNRFNVRFSTHQQAVQWLVSQEGNIELLVQHVPQPPGLQEINLKKKPNERLGLSIRGGGKGSKGNPLDPNDEGIFISKIVKGGGTERDGRLKVGMRIIEVNGISLLGASHSEAVKALKSSPEQLILTVCDGFDIKEVMERRSLANILEADAMSSITEKSYGLLSGTSSLHGLSMDGSATTPRTQKSQSAIAPSYFSVMNSKLSLSSTALSDKPLAKEEDFDNLLEELSNFKLETSHGVNLLDKERSYSVPDGSSIPLSEIIGPLQNGGMGLFDDNQDPFDQTSGTSPGSIEAELSGVEIKDTSSMLAEIDSEVSTMHEEVSKGEEEISEVQEEEKDDDVTPKPRRKSTQHLKASSQTYPTQPSPETRRRAEKIRIDISPPPNPEASEAAVKSIIGEVFSDISFDEFEATSSDLSSGIATPFSENSRSMSPEAGDPKMTELLSGLKQLGGSGSQTKLTKELDSPDGPEPDFPPVPPPKERAKTMPVPQAKDANPEVKLRQNVNPADPSKRKSAPEVAEKPYSLLSPEKLTFKEKLALHKKVADAIPSSPPHPSSISTASSPSSSSSSKTKSISFVDPASVPSPVNRTSSDGKVSSSTSTEAVPTSLSDRVAFLQSNQAKSGLPPVALKKSVTSDKRMSAEEKRMAKVLKPYETDINHASPPHHTDHDSSPSTQKLILSNTNSNDNNNNSTTRSTDTPSSMASHTSSSPMDEVKGSGVTMSVNKSKKKYPSTLV